MKAKDYKEKAKKLAEQYGLLKENKLIQEELLRKWNREVERKIYDALVTKPGAFPELDKLPESTSTMDMNSSLASEMVMPTSMFSTAFALSAAVPISFPTNWRAGFGITMPIRQDPPEPPFRAYMPYGINLGPPETKPAKKETKPKKKEIERGADGRAKRKLDLDE